MSLCLKFQGMNWLCRHSNKEWVQIKDPLEIIKSNYRNCFSISKLVILVSKKTWHVKSCSKALFWNFFHKRSFFVWQSLIHFEHFSGFMRTYAWAWISGPARPRGCIRRSLSWSIPAQPEPGSQPGRSFKSSHWCCSKRNHHHALRLHSSTHPQNVGCVRPHWLEDQTLSKRGVRI